MEGCCTQHPSSVFQGIAALSTAEGGWKPPKRNHLRRN
jgi:hypothetical protein